MVFKVAYALIFVEEETIYVFNIGNSKFCIFACIMLWTQDSEKTVPYRL